MDMWAIPIIGVIWLISAIKRGYLYLPGFELKRRGSRGNQVLYKMAATAPYQPLIRIIANLLLYIASLGLIIYLAASQSALTIILILTVTIFGHLYVSKKNSATIVRLCAWLAPHFVTVLIKLNPAYVKLSGAKKKQPVTTDIFEREDLKRLIAKQKTAVNNRISPIDLEAVAHVLEFEHRKIATVMVPYKQIKFVNAKEPIGPILLSELHKSGFQNFPVLGNSKHDVLGILSLSTLTAYEEGGHVTEAMNDTVMYVRDNQSLEQVLQAFSKTGQHLFMVVDMREKIVGLITIQDVLEEIIGHTIHSDFEEYHDPQVVAHR